MEFIPKYIKQVIDKRDSELVTAQEWNAMLNLLIQQGDHNAEFLASIAKICSTTEEVELMINKKVTEISSADMAQDVYDSNSDGIVNCADKVVDDSIQTSNIKNAAVTAEKLSDSLNDKLDYTYSNVSRLLILLGAQAEIEGSADLVLFGLDGTLASVYNAYEENIIRPMYTKTLANGDAELEHELQDLADVLNTSERYTITNDKVIHQTKLTDVTNAVRTILPTHQKFSAHKGSLGANAAIMHIVDDYYCLMVDNYNISSSDNDLCYVTLFLLKNNNGTFTIIDSLDETLYYIQELTKMGNYVYATCRYYRASSLLGVSVHRVSSSGITTIKTEYRDYERDLVYSTNGNCFWIDYSEDDLYNKRLRKNDGSSGSTVLELGTNVSADMFQFTGKWAFLKVTNRSSKAETYYWLNVLTGSLTVCNTDYSSWEDAIPDVDGIHFYRNGIKYTLSDDFQINEVCTVKDLPTGFVMLNPGLIQSGNKVYRIDNDICNLVYSLDDQKNIVQYDSNNYYSLTKLATNTDASEGVMVLWCGKDNTGVLLKGLTFDRGKVTLETPNASEDIQGPIKITRQQLCSVNVNETKQIYLQPELDGNSFQAVDLIMYLNRELESSDLLEVKVNTIEAEVEKTYTIAPTEQSGNTTKYYAQTFDATASDIEVVVTLKAGSTGTLKITQVLGGVDNEV